MGLQNSYIPITSLSKDIRFLVIVPVLSENIWDTYPKSSFNSILFALDVAINSGNISGGGFPSLSLFNVFII